MPTDVATRAERSVVKPEATDTIDLPATLGPRSPETRDAENAAKSQLLESPKARAIGSARMAGR